MLPAELLRAALQHNVEQAYDLLFRSRSKNRTTRNSEKRRTLTHRDTAFLCSGDGRSPSQTHEITGRNKRAEPLVGSNSRGPGCEVRGPYTDQGAPAFSIWILKF